MVQSGLALVLHGALGPLLTFVAYGLTRRALKPGISRSHWASLPASLVALVVPYVVWSLAVVAYTVRPGSEPFSRWTFTAISRTLAGSATAPSLAAFLIIQCYIAATLLPRCASIARRHPWKLLASSVVLQLVLVGLDYRLLQFAVITGPWAAVISTYAERCLLFWQLFVVLGVVLAIHQAPVRRWLLRHGPVAPLAFLAGLTAAIFRYVAAVEIGHLSAAQATSDLQPSMVLWGLGLAIGLLWLGYRLQLRFGCRLLNDAARLSLGILLSYVLILAAVDHEIAPWLPSSWPSGDRVLIVSLLTLAGAGIVSAAALKTPLLAWLVGQPAERMQLLQRLHPHWSGEANGSRVMHRPIRQARRLGAIAVVIVLVAGEIGLTAGSSTAWFLTFPLPRNALAKDESTVITSVGAIDCQPAPVDAYASCLFTDRPGQSMTFYLWVPAESDSGSSYPLVLLLHGGGQRANLSQSAAANEQTLLADPYAEVWGPGYPSLDAVQVQRHWPSFIIVPQVVTPNRWVNVPAKYGSYTLSPDPSASLRMAHEIVEAMVRAFPTIDRSRLYVTGLSMGGYGAWEMIERWPDLFAAAAPLSGAGDPALASRIKNLPIWALHNADDPIVPVSGSRDMIAAIRASGGHPRYTELPGAVHNSWITAYGLGSGPNPVASQFFTWLFSQQKGAPAGTG